MQSNPAKYEAEMPSLLWGLDPVFSAFARLYIKDIKEMKESKQVPGIFFYNGHPIRQVDVVGTVVLTKERDAFYNYGVDDSTGVINCICWKNPREAEKPLSGLDTSCSSDLVEQMKKLQEEVLQKTKLEIGDVVKVRGPIRIYREQREIQASIYYKVDDPMCEVQISRMLELPCLYREVYDKPFKIPEDAQSAAGGLNLRSSIDLLSEKVKDFLLENRIQTFYQQDLETVDDLVSLASQPVSRTDSQQMDSKSEPSSKLIHSAFKEAIKVLQEKGVVFQKSNSPKDVYHVTDQDKELHNVTLHVVKADCRKRRHAEKGCHFLHILCCVRQSYSPYLSEMVMHHVLNLLERNSDIVSTMEGYYMAF
ncbi:CST complex subunit STN1 isoform X1 [Mauremys reevesii]|uniref:CST complex subunit STN1 isoform X1 n=1 Tax=Mauremys reevesii TaxID=260615 RepID=UPI00193F4EAF|nr:CST complex subunit STN1 isoform X1 [Mauremys reevesii]XP_039336973.1 CST complex subunit STN1 isoform X1 [Mauremys reevesii]XP_039336974.1 CST complex subunit STN1 isoform X1 [Mauremys reevesii]XP_039336975.1 CST complex subunit STN1 isoform X1 [Mauremys reevesii]XP_039336977.1 CST complex subunit STN1 isoform X1 [Mauremys reevesii]XP_039336978.1 CST complex subunit STN1 isoform X1 [Mauremys reevesii]XP_039336979.1 CST complex subunit STN1 isoform X1 [Mauremys reevesii]XP_039336980.1 CST